MNLVAKEFVASQDPEGSVSSFPFPPRYSWSRL